jgi:hypothetical protein
LVREREEFRCSCLGDHGRCLLAQQQLDALGQDHAFLDRRGVPTDEHEAGAAPRRIARQQLGQVRLRRGDCVGLAAKHPLEISLEGERLPGRIKDGVGRNEHQGRGRHLRRSHGCFQGGDPRHLCGVSPGVRGLVRGVGGNGGLRSGLLTEEPGANTTRAVRLSLQRRGSQLRRGGWGCCAGA